jgi:hypothetical protein
MSNVIKLDEYRKKKEQERRVAALGGPCECGTIMQECTFYTDLHQGAEQYYICPTCFTFRVNYEVN